MDCASCKRANRAGARFCSSCGSPLGLRCAACGVACEAGAQFCDGCGAALARPASLEADGARKVVTILFADLVGSTSLQERLDAESTRRVMERYYAAMRAPVEAHRGTVVQLLGDGVMCAFGVPHVAEDDAIRAVRAAVAMQEAFREFAREEGAVVGSLGLRIAVNTGEVVVSDERPQGIGDPLNVAGRLQQEAREGDVLVGEATRRLVGEQVTLEHFGTFALRGRAEPVPAYRVVSLERPVGAPAIAFVGREDELRRLSAIYDSAVAAPAARLATILGSPGLGKSRLLDELARRLGGRATVLTARCDSSGGATFAPLAGAIRALLPGDGTAVAEALPPDEPERARIAAGVAALLAGTPASTEETFFVVRRFLAALAAARPVVLAIDDVQWAEPLLLDLTEHLVQWSTGVPLLVLVAARPELRDTRSSLTTSGGLVRDVVTLGGLDAGAAARLAANVVGAEELPAAVAGRVLTTSEGNPLFVGELVRMLVHDGALKRDGDRWTTGVALADVEMPPTIHALLAARIERLRPEERTVLERAAVVGRHFSRAAVSALLPRELGDLDARLESLRRSELIEPDTGWFLGEPALRFHHALIRDAAYRRVLRGTRADLHGRFADWIASRIGESVEHDETIGWHLEQAHQHLRELGPIDARGQELGSRAAKYLAAAGRRALARDDLPVAANLLGRALERLDPSDPARAELILDRCESLLAAGDVTPAAAAIADLAGFGAGSARLQAWHTCFAGQLAALTEPQSLHATVSAVAAAAQALAAAGDTAGEAKAHSVHALALQRLGKVGACEAALDLALAAARRVRDRRRSNAVLAGAPLAALWGPSPVTRASGRCLDVVRVLRITQGAPAVEAVALRCQAVLEALRGRTEAARRMLASSRRMVEELGLTPQLLEADVFSGLIDLLEGDPVAAERSLRAAYDGLREHGLGIDAARAAALLARALLAQGRVAEGEALSEESESLAGDDLQAAISWRGARAQALVRRGEHALAVDFARAAVEIAAATDALLHHADARSSLATALRAAGRSAEADAEQRRAIELWEAKGATTLAEAARRGAGPAAAAPASDAPALSTVHVRPRVRPNAATELVTRLDAIVQARDAEGLSRLLADSLSIVHHPTGTELGPEGGLSMLTALLRAENHSFRTEPLATLGDSLVLCHTHNSISALGGDDVAPFGAIDGDLVAIMEVNDRGRQRRAELFAVDRLNDAIARLYALYAESLSDGPERSRATATARSVAAVLGVAGDHAAFRAVLAPDVEFADHRQLGFGKSRGADAVRRGSLVLHDVAQELRTPVAALLALRSDGLVAHRTVRGVDAASGGPFERDLVELWCFGADGLLAHLEHFDPGDASAALARFDALAVESPATLRRRVRPNAATANAARTEAAVAARDFDAFQSLFADGARNVHHPTRTAFSESESMGSYRQLLNAEGVAMQHEPLATLGESLALFRASVSFRSLRSADGLGPFGAVDTELVMLIEVDGAGRRRLSEAFAPDQLGDALTRLYELHAESLPDGPARTRATATARSIATMLELDLERFATGIAPGVEFADHGPIGLESSRGKKAILRGLGALHELALEVSLTDDDVLALEPDLLLARCTTSGTDRISGGAFERHFLALWVFGSDGLATHIEWFAPDGEAEAFARIDELTAPVEPLRRRVRPNAATANAARLDAAASARDFAAFQDQFAEGAQVVHHPTGTRFEESRNFSDYQRLLQSPSFAFANEPVATLGDSLGLFRASLSIEAVSWDGSLDVGGTANEWFLLKEVDAAGRCRHSEFFATDRLGDAVARLYERHAESLPEAKARARAAATAASVSHWLKSFDDFEHYVAPEVEFVDHRPVGLGSLRGVELVRPVARAQLELARDIVFRVDDVLALQSDAFLVRSTTSGVDRASGGAYERPLLAIGVFGAEGLATRVEWFEPERQREALARFDELIAESHTRRRRVPPNANAATRAVEQMERSWAERDWPAVVGMSAPGFRLEDRRALVGLPLAGQDFRVNLRRMFDMPASRWRLAPMATRGERLALFHSRLTGEVRDGGPVEFEHLSLVEVDARGQYLSLVVFEADQTESAYAELDRRYSRGTVASTSDRFANAASRAVAEFERAWRERDWNGVLATFVPTHHMDDRRRLMRVAISGADFLANERMLFEEPASEWQGTLLATRGERLALLRTRFRTEVEGSGPMSVEMLDLVEVDSDGRRSALVVFDLDAVDAAYAELDRRYVAGEGAAWAELITHQKALVHAAVSRDKTALERLLPADFSAWNRQRFGGTGERTTRAQFIAFSHALEGLEVHGAIRLDHLPRISPTTAVAVTTWHGTRDGGTFEVLQCAVCTHDGRRLHSWEIFDLEQLDLAYARYDELTAEPVTPVIENAATRAMARGTEAVEAGDWERFSAFFRPDYRNSDRRRMVLLELDRTQYLEFLRAFLMRQQTTFELVATRGARLAMFRFRWAMREDGAAGPSEGDFLTIAEVDEAGLIVAQVFYDSDSLDAAHAELERRFAALEGSESRDPLHIPPNAASRIGDRLQQAIEARDWDGLRALLAPGMEYDDRRRGALLHGDVETFVASARIYASNQGRMKRTLLATAGDRHSLTLLRRSGRTPDVEAWELESLSLLELDADGRIARVLAFDPADRSQASAEMFERYARGEGASSLSSAALEGIRAMNARDLERLRASLPSDFVLSDHRRTGLGRIEGPDAFIRSLAALFEGSRESTVETLYTLETQPHGELAMARMLGTIANGGEFESAYLRIITRDGSMEFFEPEDLELARSRFEELRPK